MIDGTIRDHFDSLTEEDRKEIRTTTDQASSEGTPQKIEVPGRYRVKARSFAWRNKDTKEMDMFPKLTIAKKTKALMLQLSLAVVDGTDLVSAGSTVFHNIVLTPAKGATKEKVGNTVRLMKPQLVALTGLDSIDVGNIGWVEDHLVTEYKEVDDKFELVKEHKMNQEVMAVIDETLYEGKSQYQIKSLSKAMPGDKSVSYIVEKSEENSEVVQPTEDAVANNAANEEDAASDMASTVIDVSHMEEDGTPDY